MYKKLTGILSATALATCFGLNLNCENEDAENTDTGDTETTDTGCSPADHPRTIQKTLTANLETLEEKIVPLDLTDPLGKGLKYSVASGWDEAPIKIELMEDYQSPDAGTDSTAGYALKITAPEFPLMSGSDYITSTTETLRFSNQCGSTNLDFLFNMQYGCAPITLKIEKFGGMRYAKIIGSRYRQDTKVTIKTGQKIHLFADGEICWSKFDPNTCQGAKQQLGLTWGLWVKIDENYYPLDEITTIEHSGKKGELSFIVADGSRPYETLIAGDEQHCTDDVFKDSGGKGIDVNFYVE